VAIDLTCADAVNAQQLLKRSLLDDCCKEQEHSYYDHFKTIGLNTNWKTAIERDVKIGLGRNLYELIEVR